MGYKIKEARESIGISQAELSKKANVSRATISGLESGRIVITTTKTLEKIAQALGKSLNDILFSILNEKTSLRDRGKEDAWIILYF